MYVKLIHVSDMHVVRAGERLHGLDPVARFAACIEDINTHHADAELCVFTGDLVQSGEIAQYRELRTLLEPLKVPARLTVGNHDDRGNFQSVFPEAPCDPGGFVQSVAAASAGRIVVLDTKTDSRSSTATGGVNWGTYCEQRAGWLGSTLDSIGDEDVFLFMHHPPFPIGVPSLDHEENALRDDGRFVSVIRGRTRIRHLFLGHVHRPVAGSWQGIPYSAVRSTNHQVALDFDIQEPVPKNHEAPSYAIVYVTRESTVVHYHDFLDRSAERFALLPDAHGVRKYRYVADPGK